MPSIPTSQTTDMVRRNIITPEAVWEERRTIEVSWLHSAGWLIRIIKRTRRIRLEMYKQTKICNGPLQVKHAKMEMQ